MFNQSLALREVPDDWKLAYIFAFYKKDHRSMWKTIDQFPSCVCSKIIEHIVFTKVSWFLDNYNIISAYQHGFCSDHSCETQLISAVSDWSHSLDHGIPTDVAIFDFCKAFDSVPHTRMLYKLDYYGI